MLILSLLDHQGAMAFIEASYGQGQGRIFWDNVQSNGSEVTLLECSHHGLFTHNCLHIEDAGIKCNRDIIIKNISASIIRLSTPCVSTYTALITWTSRNTIHEYQLNSYKIECFSRQHHIKMLVNSTTFSVELLGLLPSASYNCCVSAVYGSSTARAVCTEIVTIQPHTNKPGEAAMMQPPIVKGSDQQQILSLLVEYWDLSLPFFSFYWPYQGLHLCTCYDQEIYSRNSELLIM